MERFLVHMEIPVKKTVDVLIIGGGTAGSFAAICAGKGCPVGEIPLGILKEELIKIGAIVPKK